jgi:hypothetical protein
LPRPREQLTSEYRVVVNRKKIERAAQQTLGEFEDARVREFMSVLACRRARSRLRQPPQRLDERPPRLILRLVRAARWCAKHPFALAWASRA